MLEFINNNGVLFSGIFSIIVAVISIIVSLIKDRKTNRIETIRSLNQKLEKTTSDLKETKTKLEQANSIKELEKNIDKTNGVIYNELLDTGTHREICGYCWEKEHIKIPLVVNLCYDEHKNQEYFDRYCYSCKNHFYEDIHPDIPTEASNSISDENLPF